MTQFLQMNILSGQTTNFRTMEDILKNRFNTVYAEWKTYGEYISTTKATLEKERAEFNKFAKDNMGNKELLVNKLFEISYKQTLHQIDYKALADRLIATFDAYNLVIEIPTEVCQEIADLTKVDIIFKIQDGEAIAIDAKKLETTKENLKDNFEKILKNMGTDE